MFSQLTTWLVDTIGRMGYSGLVLLMAMESSVLPVPAELVMPPAGYLAAKGELNVVLALVCGVVGSMLGAWANYWVSRNVGRWVFVRYGKWVLLSERSLERTERFFQKHGEIATFVGRLFPVLRHLISIPAGLARMPLGRFFAYTASGATIWCAILLAIGWFIGKNEAALSHALVADYSRRAVLVLLPIVIMLIVAYVWRARRAMERV